MPRKKVIRLLLVVLIVAAGSAWWLFNKQDNQVENTLVLYGNVDIRETDLTFNNSEHIDALLVQEGDRVHAGQLLATLHRQRTQAEVDAAEARVAAQKAVVDRLESGSRPQEIRQAQANVAAATAKLVDARATFDRVKNLSNNQSISKQALDDAQANIDMARADLNVAKESLALYLEGPRVEDIEEARATLKGSEAQLALTLEILKDTELYAPADGIIRNRILEPGDMVTPQTPVFTLALSDPVWVRAYAPETYLGALVPGMVAEVSTDSYPDKTYSGWIGFISPTAEFTPKSVQTVELRTRLVYQLRVFVCNPQGELRLGMPATVSISLDQPKPKSGDITSICTQQDNG